MGVINWRNWYIVFGHGCDTIDSQMSPQPRLCLGYGEIWESVVLQSWPKTRFQFLLYHGNAKLLLNKEILPMQIMMTSSNGNIFRVTGPLCGEFTGPGEFPTQRPVTGSFDVFFDLRLNKRLSKHSWGWWFETLSWSLWRHHNVLETVWQLSKLPEHSHCKHWARWPDCFSTLNNYCDVTVGLVSQQCRDIRETIEEIH